MDTNAGFWAVAAALAAIGVALVVYGITGGHVAIPPVPKRVRKLPWWQRVLIAVLGLALVTVPTGFKLWPPSPAPPTTDRPPARHLSGVHSSGDVLDHGVTIIQGKMFLNSLFIKLQPGKMMSTTFDVQHGGHNVPARQFQATVGLDSAHSQGCQSSVFFEATVDNGTPVSAERDVSDTPQVLTLQLPPNAKMLKLTEFVAASGCEAVWGDAQFVY